MGASLALTRGPGTSNPQPVDNKGEVTVPDDRPLPLKASTEDDNVARARIRRDRLPAAHIAEATAVVGRYLAAQSRAPFRALLTEMIGGKPTPEAIARFADKYPDRWAQAISILSGLSGYERGIVEINVFNIKALSDSELMARLDQVEGELRQTRRRTGPVQDAEIVSEAPNEPETPK